MRHSSANYISPGVWALVRIRTALRTKLQSNSFPPNTFWEYQFIYCLISIDPLHYRPVRPIYDVKDDESEREYDEERGVDGGDPLAVREMVRQD